MMAGQDLPLFPVTVVGSWSRPSWLLDALRKQIPDTMVEKYMKTLRSPHASR